MNRIRVQIFILIQFLTFGLSAQHIKVYVPTGFYLSDFDGSGVPEKSGITFSQGFDSLERFLYNRLQYPQKALDAEISGIVSINIEIDGEGRIVKQKLFGKVPQVLEEEVNRVIKLTEGLWTKQAPDKRHFNSWAYIIVSFQVPKTKKFLEFDEVDTGAQLIGGKDAVSDLIADFVHPAIGADEIIDYFDICFIVNRDSTVSDIQVLNAGSSENWKKCVEEIRRMVMLSNKKWAPAVHNGAYVRQRVRMPFYTCFDEY